MTISRELASGVHGVTGSISHESIYRAVYAHGTRDLPKGLHEGLHRRRRCRRRRTSGGADAKKKSPLGQFNPIAKRPAIADARTEVGHYLEGDLITGTYNRSAQRINTMPRRSLRWPTAHDVYTPAVAMTG